MRQKPWPILILALIHLLLPLLNAEIAARMSGLAFLSYLQLFFRTESFFQIFTHFMLLPLAGLAIFSFRNWSYPLYLGLMGWASYDTLWSFHSLPHLTNLGAFALPIAVNLVLIGYFLVPSVRQLYFNKSLRWWEAQERLPWKTSCKLKTSLCTLPAEIENISVGGCFIKVSTPLIASDDFYVLFKHGDQSFELPAQGVYFQVPTASVQGAGLRFVHSSGSRKKVRKLVSSLKKGGLAPLNRVPLTGAGFMKWLKRAVTTGQGLFPERD